MIEVQESLKRKLLAVKLNFDPQEIRDYVTGVIQPQLRSVQISRLSLLLRARTGETIVAELTDGFLGDQRPYVRLLEALSLLHCNCVTLHIPDSILSCYSENEWDWILLKYDRPAQAFMEPLIDAFWPPFFDFA